MTAVFIILFHILVYITYPETTIFGIGYLIMSTFISIFVYYSLKNLFRLTNHKNLIVMRIIFFTILAIFTFHYYPQRDKISVFQKLAQGRYPNRLTIYKSLKRFGIDAKFLLEKEKRFLIEKKI